MKSPNLLLSTIESTLLGPSPPSPRQRIQLLHAILSSLPSLQSLLSFPPLKASDRAQVQSKEVRLLDAALISLDDRDVQIALKLSDDLNLNEISCIQLLLFLNREWGLAGREPLEILPLASGLWYRERRDLITSLYALLRAVVLDQELDVDLLADIQKFLEDLFNSGLRQRLITLLKDFSAKLKDSAELKDGVPTLKLQIVFSLLFSLVISFMSDALSAVSNKASVASSDASFRHEFREPIG